MNSIPQNYNGKPLIYAWPYRDKDGAALGIVARYQNGSDKKDIVPFFKLNGLGFTAGIELSPRPLFGLDYLAKHLKNKAVFIVEGEKNAAALQSIGLCAVTSLGGSQAANKADWKPLNGYKMAYLLPDKDEPGEQLRTRCLPGALGLRKATSYTSFAIVPVAGRWRYSGLDSGLDWRLGRLRAY
ncbi:MAG: hypothetical protein PHG00_16340 [Methylococcales bacterium]|nr:hypothetical protein [Methylococcales bacterium]